MAILKSTTVQGSINVTGDTDTSNGTLKLKTINAPTDSLSPTTYGPGTIGQILKSNGVNVYWATDADSNYYPIRDYTTGLKISTSGGTTNTCDLYVPEANSTTQAGVVSTGAQTFGGTKTFDSIYISNDGGLGFYNGSAFKKAIIAGSETRPQYKQGTGTAADLALLSDVGIVQANFLYDQNDGAFVSSITQAEFETIKDAKIISYLDEANDQYTLYLSDKWSNNQQTSIVFKSLVSNADVTLLTIESNGVNATVTVSYPAIGSQFYEHNITVKQQYTSSVYGVITTKLVNNNSTAITTEALLWSALNSAGYAYSSDTLYISNVTSANIISAAGFTSKETVSGLVALLNSPKIGVVKKLDTDTSISVSNALALLSTVTGVTNPTITVSDYVRILS